MFQALQELTQETQKLQKEIELRGKDALTKATKHLLDNYPQIHEIYWTQYTPYFCDGEPCYFSVNELNVLILDPAKQAQHNEEKAAFEKKQEAARGLSEEQRKALGIELEEWVPENIEALCNEEYVSKYSADKKRAVYGECWDGIVQLADWISHDANKDTMEAVFGDHVRVSITRSGISITEYEHD